jgi:hypothetical protein
MASSSGKSVVVYEAVTVEIQRVRRHAYDYQYSEDSKVEHRTSTDTVDIVKLTIPSECLYRAIRAILDLSEQASSTSPEPPEPSAPSLQCSPGPGRDEVEG